MRNQGKTFTKTLRKVIDIAELLPPFFVPESESVMVKGHALSDMEKEHVLKDGHELKDDMDYKIDYVKNIQQDHRIAMKYIYGKKGMKGLIRYFHLVNQLNKENNDANPGLNLPLVDKTILSLNHKTILHYGAEATKRVNQAKAEHRAKLNDEAATALSIRTNQNSEQ